MGKMYPGNTAVTEHIHRHAGRERKEKRGPSAETFTEHAVQARASDGRLHSGGRLRLEPSRTLDS